jgi:hypothetical protein
MKIINPALARVRENSFSVNQQNKTSENPAPEGRPSLAQRFSAGKSG